MNETEAHSAALGVTAVSSSSVDEASAPRARASTTRRWLGWGPAGAAALIGALSLLLPIGWSGLWAPYELEVAESDLGKVIGRGGKTARALRTVVQAIAPRSRKRTLVEILE